MLPLRGLRHCLYLKSSCTIRTYRMEKVQTRSHGSLLPTLRSVGRVGENPGNEVGESACPRVYPPDMIHGVNKCVSFRELRNFLACLVFYKSTCILGTGQLNAVLTHTL